MIKAENIQVPREPMLYVNLATTILRQLSFEQMAESIGIRKARAYRWRDEFGKDTGWEVLPHAVITTVTK